ncbi:MAG: hypothetical protein IKV97_03650 [Clostridia bacterium]|nr:hypothetical protein [Clostridia bacterium]
MEQHPLALALALFCGLIQASIAVIRFMFLFMVQMWIMILGNIPGTPISHYKPAGHIEFQEKITDMYDLSEEEWREQIGDYAKPVGDDGYLFACVDNKYSGNNLNIDLAVVTPDGEGEFVVRSVSLVSNKDGTVIFSLEDADEELKNHIYTKAYNDTVFTTEVSRKWYRKGNSLTLTVDVEHEGEIHNCVFDVEIIEEYRPTSIMPTV